MVRYSLNDVQPGMVLGESLFLRSQELLLSAGFRLKQEQIISLKKRGFSSVLINVEGTEDVIPETVISTHLHQEMALCLSKMETDFVDAFTVQAEGIQAIEKFIAENKHKLSKFLTTSQIGPKVEEFIQEILSKPVTILNMAELLKAESGLFYHAMNVAVLSLCIGKKFRFSTEEMKQLGIGAMHYDLGMVAVPRQILAKKRDDLTEDETAMLRQHTVFGYLMLSQNSLFAPTSAAVAYQHHERQDGSGYPRGISGRNSAPDKDLSHKNIIHRFSEIVAVADTYEMLLAGRGDCSRAVSTPEAIKRVIEMSGAKLNSSVVKALVSIVPLYPAGARIRVIRAPTPILLGSFGVIAKNNPDRFSRPFIILFESKDHKRMKPILIDTANSPGYQFELIL